MNAAIERSVWIPDEASLAHRSVRRDESRNKVGGSIQNSQRYLRIRNRFLRADQSRAAAADGRLRMAHGAAVAVERRPQPASRLNCPRYRVDFLKPPAVGGPGRGPGSCCAQAPFGARQEIR